VNFLNLLFGLNGRIRRLPYWMTAIGASLGLGVISSGLLAAGISGSGELNPIVMLPLSLVLICAAWIGLAVGVKRCHDRDKSGLFMLVGLIPLAGGLWLLIELGFLEGTPGPNRFGPATKPLAVIAPA
jgi:uncharacterized membrane protein YhaH (DUF805 family)